MSYVPKRMSADEKAFWSLKPVLCILPVEESEEFQPSIKLPESLEDL